MDRDSGQIHMPGVFGHPNAPSTYNVGFGTSLPGSGRGAADMFWLSLLRDDPATLDAMVSIIVDGSGSMDDKWDDVTASIERIFREEPFTVRRTGGVAINVVTFSTGSIEAVPWTVVDETSIDSITALLADLPRIPGGTGLWLGIDFALTRFEASPLESLTDDAHKIMLVVGDGCNNYSSGTPTIDRASILSRMQTLGWPAEVAGVPIGTSGADCGSLTLIEYYEQEIATLSQASGAMQLVYPAAAASDPSDPDHFEYQFRGIFKALTCCRADFDGDGVHDFWPDYDAFEDLHSAIPPHPAADLNFDGDWTSADFTVFQDYASEPCPCGL